MEKKEILKDGKKVTIRELSPGDLDKLMAFYRSLPEEDRKYLRVDVTKRDVVEQRIKLIETGQVFRLIALHNDEIAADGSLDLLTEDWQKNFGELRVIVALPFRRNGLGTLMMRELYFLASQKNIEKIIVRMMRPQVAARKICHKLGFREEVIIPDYVKDLTGETQDLVIMSCDLKDLIQEIEDIYSNSDWERCR